jgi:protein-S-isoprenylcysteine O-methyltransferase Ste14
MFLLIGMVSTRVLLMKKRGIKAVHFGNIDKKDFLIPPFALYYFYLVIASTFNFPGANRQDFFRSGLIPWFGVLFCLAGLLLFLWSLVSFKQSFRVGIDIEHPDRLITTGIFAFSRNPIFVALVFILAGQFLVCPNWIFLAYLGTALWLIHRQVLREEEYLKTRYGQEYSQYCDQVRRYI